LAEAGVEASVGSVGDAYDNALAETINGLFKAEETSSTRRSNGSTGSTTGGC
jgi:transposase InsO family protein